MVLCVLAPCCEHCKHRICCLHTGSRQVWRCTAHSLDKHKLAYSEGQAETQQVRTSTASAGQQMGCYWRAIAIVNSNMLNSLRHSDPTWGKGSLNTCRPQQQCWPTASLQQGTDLHAWPSQQSAATSAALGFGHAHPDARPAAQSLSVGLCPR